MRPSARDPDLDAVTAALVRRRALFVLIGGFAVIAHDFVRATEDVNVLIPADDENDHRCEHALVDLDAAWAHDGATFERSQLVGREHARVVTSAGLIDLLREGGPPLDYATVAGGATRADLGAGPFLVAGLRSLVSFKRLADRPRDRLDLEELRAIHGTLPRERVPGLDP